jgi:hypothetical protein
MKQVTRFWCVSHTDISPLILWRNQQTEVRLVLRLKLRNCRDNFKTQITKSELLVLRPKPETIDLGFEAQPRNSRSSSSCVRYGPHTASPDLLIIRPPSTRHVIDHPRSSTPDLLLLPRFSSLSVMSHLSPTHHEISKRNSPNKTRIKVKLSKCLIQIQTRHVNDSSHIKPMYWPLGFSISPVISTLTTKNAKFESRIQYPIKHR